MNWLAWVFQPGVFTQTFMIHAYLSGTIIAALSAVIGVFIVMRSWTFVAHALPKIGFAGASGAVLVGVSPLVGVVLFTLGGAITIGNWSRNHRNDVVTALTLVLSLGTGALFLALSGNFAQNTYALLFGQVVGISAAQVRLTLVFGLLCILAVAVLYRPLLLGSIQSQWAEARGVSVKFVDMAFLIVAGIAAALTVPLVGVLLNFSLLVAPAAAAIRLARHPAQAVGWAVMIGIVSVWVSLLLAYDIGWPVGFFVAAVTSVIYIGVHIATRSVGITH